MKTNIEQMKKIDCTKIKKLEDVKLILEALDLHVNVSSEHYEKIKHLVSEK
jgi:hypothetical protein